MSDGNVRLLKTAAVDGPANIPAKLRELADQIERNNDVRTCMVVLDVRPNPNDAEENRICVDCYGYRPMRHEAMGLLEYAKMLQVPNG